MPKNKDLIMAYYIYFNDQNKAHTPCVGLCKPISMGALLSILVDDAVKLIKMIK